MLTFLFWNVRRERKLRRGNSHQEQSGLRLKRIVDTIAELAGIHEADILVFAELEVATSDMLTGLTAKTGYVYEEAEPDQCTKIRIFTRFPKRYCLSIPGAGDTRYTVREVTLPSRMSLLLAAAHFPDKSHTTDFTRSSYSRDVAENLEITEGIYGHQNTVLVGDLNMNPYEAGVTGGLKAVMTRDLAMKGKDRISGRHTRFYNPMWQHFGEANNTPAGTYYRLGSEDEHYWNIFDQVLLRPPLLPYFSDSYVQILAVAAQTTLVTRTGAPRAAAVSDHLPILFRLNL